MASANLFAFCSTAVCVAEDTAVSFFAPKSLNKFRVERFNGRRICGIHIQHISSRESLLHVIDAQANWYTVALESIRIVSSCTIELPKQTVRAAHFHEADGQLQAVLLTQQGVYQTPLCGNSPSATELFKFEKPSKDLIMAVGKRTGLVVVAQPGQRWLQYFTNSSSATTEESANSTVVKQISLAVDLQSVACSPVENAVAVGGTRGELLYFSNIEDNHYFSDHWHHTPLAGIQFSVDGAAVYTGALESILLVWNLTSLTHKKIVIRLGNIRCIIPSVTKGNEVLLACESSTLAVVDLLQMRVEKSVDGIEWSCGDTCAGLVVEQFRGQPVVILTGLSSILRVCDPVTQQSVYTLHISSQMETIPTPPRHGIRFAGMLRDGRIIVTYEHFAGTTLPSLLRFWSYDAKAKKHVSSQTIYSPHQSEVVALQVDKVNERVFTLSSDSLKCWEEAEEDANGALKGQSRVWRNQCTSPTPSSRVSSFSLSTDGSLGFVADDVVGVYSMENCRPGYDLPCVVRLYQNVTTEALQNVLLLDSSKVVVARQGKSVYFWSLANCKRQPVLYTHTEELTALCAFTATSVLVADATGHFLEISGDSASLGQLVGTSRTAQLGSIIHIAALPGDSGRVAVVDRANGFRVLNVSILKKRATVEHMRVQSVDDSYKESSLRTYFRTTEGAGADGLHSHTLTAEAKRGANANKWLQEVLHEPSYAVAPLSTVFSLYMRRQMIDN